MHIPPSYIFTSTKNKQKNKLQLLRRQGWEMSTHYWNKVVYVITENAKRKIISFTAVVINA